MNIVIGVRTGTQEKNWRNKGVVARRGGKSGEPLEGDNLLRE